ncbi:MAG: hypothetical protein KF809_04115 [Chloroflexi bacterium]|nr:hypothetical protein [Chloroflexota bacterium]
MTPQESAGIDHARPGAIAGTWVCPRHPAQVVAVAGRLDGETVPFVQHAPEHGIDERNLFVRDSGEDGYVVVDFTQWGPKRRRGHERDVARKTYTPDLGLVTRCSPGKCRVRIDAPCVVVLTRAVAA